MPYNGTLGSLIATLEQVNPELILPRGFGLPHSYRGIYTEVAFVPEAHTTVRSVLAAARSALRAGFEGYKGGRYTMHPHTTVYLAEYGCTGETLGPALLECLLAQAYLPETGKPESAPTPATPSDAAGRTQADLETVMHAIPALIRLCESTAVYPHDETNHTMFGVEGNALYCSLGLAGEVGEFMNKLKRGVRGDFDGMLSEALDTKVADPMRMEVFDVFWYTVMLLNSVTPDPCEVLRAGFQKLLRRAEEGTIQGSGDDR